jgi:hypothetical protein
MNPLLTMIPFESQVMGDYMIKSISLSFLLAFAGLALPSAAQAVDVGDALNCNITGGGLFECDLPTNTVQDGTEFVIGTTSTDFLGADFSAGVFRLSALQNSVLGSTILNFSNATSPFTSFALTGTSGFSGFDVSDVTLSNGLLTIDLRGTTNTAGDFINLSLGSVGAVPEPATWALMLLGFGFVGGAMRTAKRRQTLVVSHA